MQLRNLVIGRKVQILLVEERRRVQPVGAAMHEAFPMNRIRSGGGTHVDVRAAGRALLRVIHGSVDTKFLDSLRSGRGQCLPDRQVHGSRALNGCRAGAGSVRHAGIVDNARRRYLTSALAVKQVAGVDAVQQKSVAGVALAIGPDRLVAQAGVGARSPAQFRIHAGRKNRQSRKTPRG